MLGRRLVAIMLSVLAALTLGIAASAPAAAQSTATYRTELNQLTLDMRAMWGEIERFKVENPYCNPSPPPPSKAQAQAELAALEQRANDLNRRYNALKQNLLNFLDRNHRLYAEMMVNGRDPRDRQWWSRDDNNRQRMLDELARKKAALAAAREVDCRPKPKPRPPVTTGGGFQPPSLPVRPSTSATAWPALPTHFCSYDEKIEFLKKVGALLDQAGADAERTARFRTEVEQAVNSYVQNDRQVPPELIARRRQAIADVEAANRRVREANDNYNRANAIPVIDCRKQGTQTGTAPPQTATDQQDARLVRNQQQWIAGIEAEIAAVDRLRLAGKCTEVYAEAELIRREISEMSRVAMPRSDGTRGLFLPPQVIAELKRRLAAATEPCPPRTQTTPPPTTPSQTGFIPPPNSVEWRILDVHNKERAAVGARPLQWDPALAASASAYAQQLARGGPFVHAPRAGRENERENLTRGLPGASPERMMVNWTGEKRNFVPGTYPNVSKTGNWSDVSHYTQMIWPTTTRVGCGTARGARQEVMVCRYTPPGNREGRQVLADNATVVRPDLPRLPVGGGMQQIDPPPPPRPTAADPAPDGNEALHPLATLFAGALNRHYEALRNCDAAAARRALDEMRYALGELRKRLKDARAVGGFSTVNPDELQRLIDGLERVLRGAEQRSQPGTCPPR